MKKLLLIPLLLFKLASSVEIKELFAPQKLGKLALYHNKNKFWVHHKGGYHKVENAFVDKNLRNIDSKSLAAFLTAGYITVNKMSDDEWTLKANVRGLGGGPVSGWIAYNVAKVVGYGLVIGSATAATGAVVVATGGAAAGPIAAMATTAATSSVGGGLAAATLGAGLGSSCAAGALATGGSVLAATSGVASVVAGVETASVGIGALFVAIPFLP